jgi:ABC-2 type transport system permease protein
MNRVDLPYQEQRGGAGLRVRGLIRKEFIQILRDPSSIAMAFLMPLVLLLLFGYGVSLNAEHVPIALVVEQPGPETTDFTGRFLHSHYFTAVIMFDMHEAVAALMAHRVDGIIRLRPDYARQLKNADNTPVQLIVNGVDANNARLIAGYVQGALAIWQAQQAQRTGRPVAGGPVRVQQRVWFNSALRSRDYLVPGLVAIIMTLIGALLTAMVMAREWERGTLEALLVTRVTRREILLGKLIPYFILGLGGMTLSVAMAVGLFAVPLRGSVWVLAVSAALFLLVALGMGLLISVLAKNQFVAGQAAIVTTFLPAFILSGFIFDIDSMPWVVRMLTHVIAARYFVSILQTVFLAGNVWSVIVPNALALGAMAIIFLGLTRIKFRKRLD